MTFSIFFMFLLKHVSLHEHEICLKSIYFALFVANKKTFRRAKLLTYFVPYTTVPTFFSQKGWDNSTQYILLWA